MPVTSRGRGGVEQEGDIEAIFPFPLFALHTRSKVFKSKFSIQNPEGWAQKEKGAMREKHMRLWCAWLSPSRWKLMFKGFFPLEAKYDQMFIPLPP